MVKVKKKGGELVDFEPAKLESSIVKVGVVEELAKEIAGSIRVEEGMETANIRTQVVSALQAKEQSEAAKRYEEFRKE
ncbi:MAG: ATP cone domain-containing protein [Thermoplasmatales archaeon]|nr:ATP cone domain-containing protein [Thermoplasmatales archaeon]